MLLDPPKRFAILPFAVYNYAGIPPPHLLTTDFIPIYGGCTREAVRCSIHVSETLFPINKDKVQHVTVI